MKDDLYARYQTLVALVGVLLHDLRNPLHNATLLVEARSLDHEVLRTKLRAQFGKLEALLGVATDSMRELVIEPQIGEVDVDELVRSAAEAPVGNDEEEPQIELPAPTGLKILADGTMLGRALAELTAHIVDEVRRVGAPGPKAGIKVIVEEGEGGTVNIRVGELPVRDDDNVAKAPFSIAGGGIHLAVARALSQAAGARLRFDQKPGAGAYFAFVAPRAPNAR
jgi:signal transduction histidine kinase